MKRMITKLALAFAAKKGVEMWRSAGGIDGVRKAMADSRSGGAAQTGTQSGMAGRVGGSNDALSEGIGNILGSLGIGGATGGREAGATGQISPLNQSLGGLFGTLAGALNGQNTPGPDASSQQMEAELSMQDVEKSDEARPIIHAMVQMARADGQIDEAEQAALMDILEDASEDEKHLVQDALRNPLDADGIARETPSHATKEVYAAALLVGDPDNLHDRAFLGQLARALNLADGDVERLENGMGKRRAIA